MTLLIALLLINHMSLGIEWKIFACFLWILHLITK